MKKIILITLSLLLLSSCTGSRILDIKSPCVSLEDGPCGPKKPINDWWLNKENNFKS